MFRSRPPNTSRPPSMHVDDFVKLETQNHQQPTPDVISVSIAAARRPEVLFLIIFYKNKLFGRPFVAVLMCRSLYGLVEKIN